MSEDQAIRQALDRLEPVRRRLWLTSSGLVLAGWVFFFLYGGAPHIPIDERFGLPAVALLVLPLVSLALAAYMSRARMERLPSWLRTPLLMIPGPLGAAAFVLPYGGTPVEFAPQIGIGLLHLVRYSIDAWRADKAFTGLAAGFQAAIRGEIAKEGPARLFPHIPEVRFDADVPDDHVRQRWLADHGLVTRLIRRTLLPVTAAAGVLALAQFAMALPGSASPAWSLLVAGVVLIATALLLRSVVNARTRVHQDVTTTVGYPIPKPDAERALRSTMAIRTLVNLDQRAADFPLIRERLSPYRGRISTALRDHHDTLEYLRFAWLSYNLPRWRALVNDLVKAGEHAEKTAEMIRNENAFRSID
ncbi:hypothetical protein Pth03_74200 [Planotetraspora thailandica]|uniref:Uncharacterized protein n=1 Tax=Planotetraspora thailandica TaxID=487172 RepID=A0A8J3Y1G7_9ACTN|nr:hypothetical protein [Planotetraspora thailandica]GII59031.1 hypothetical protein Pth03_74200 [Planotetraspora thailandica]